MFGLKQAARPPPPSPQGRPAKGAVTINSSLCRRQMWRALLFSSLFLFILCKLGPRLCQQIAFQEVCNFCVLPPRSGGSALNRRALGFVKPSRAQSLLRAQSDQSEIAGLPVLHRCTLICKQKKKLRSFISVSAPAAGSLGWFEAKNNRSHEINLESNRNTLKGWNRNDAR